MVLLLLVPLTAEAQRRQRQEQGWGPGNPPTCNDERALKRTISNYDLIETMPHRQKRKIGSHSVPVELGMGEPQRSSVAPYPPDFKQTARYCKMEVVLDNGEKDEVFFRFAVIEESAGKKPYLAFEHCSKRHDTFEDNCKSMRERRG